MYFYLLLLAMVHAILGIQMRTNEFYLLNSGNPTGFGNNVYIFTNEECRYKANILDFGVLKRLDHASAPYGCYLSREVMPPTMYWNGVDRSNDCSQDFPCVVGDATSRDTFFYGKLTIKNISERRETQQKFKKQLFDATPTVTTENVNVSVRQDDCKTNCDSAFNTIGYTNGACQTWEFKPMEIFRNIPEPKYQATVDMFAGATCNGNLHCKALCTEDTSCMGYSSYNQKSTDDWPETTALYGDNDCDNEQDCINKCVADETCNGYTEYWWPVLADATQTDTEEIPAELCTIDLLPLLYPSGHQFEDVNPSYDTGSYIRSMSTDNNNVLGCQIIDDTCTGATANVNSYTVGSKSGNCHQNCYIKTTQQYVFRNDLGYNIFYSSTGSLIDSVSTFTTSVVHQWQTYYSFLYSYQYPSIQGTCSFNRVNRQIRKRSKWAYGLELSTTTRYFTNSRHYTFNDVVYLYGLKSLTIPPTLQLKQSYQGIFRYQDNDYRNNEYSLTEQECASIALGQPYDMWSEYNIDEIQIYVISNGQASLQHKQKSNSIMTSINSDKLPYGCIVPPTGKIYWNNDFSNSNFKQCGLFKVQTYNGYEAQSTLSSSSGLDEFLTGNSHYSVTCLQHPLIQCTWTSGGGAQLYEKDLSDFPTTNNDIAYVQSNKRISLLQPIKKNAEDALRYCLDLCDRTEQCFYATIGDDNACEMYRKCESTSVSNKALYRKVPFFLNLSSTLSNQVNDYYYDIGVLDNTCAISEPRPECYLDYCNRHLDIKALLCDDTCNSDEELEACRNHWNTTGSLDASRNFDPSTECTRSLVLAETSDADCPTFCITTEGCNIAYQTEDACYALPQCIMSSGEAKGHVITKIVRDQSYHQLFPYNAFWACDAVVLENTDIDACVREARRENRFVFSYNNDTRKCLVYEHYVKNAYDEFMDNGINASWCYSNNVLQNAITSLGTCSAAVQNEDNQVLQVVDGAFKTLVVGNGYKTEEACREYANVNQLTFVEQTVWSDNHANCPAWADANECSSNAGYMWGNCRRSCASSGSPTGCVRKVLSGEATTVWFNKETTSRACGYAGVQCVEDREVRSALQTTCIDKFTTLTSTATIDLSSNLLTYLNVVDALTACFETSDCNYIVKYTAQQQIVLAKDVTVTVHEVSSGTPDMSVNAAQCQAYAEATSGLIWNRVDSWSHYHKGCSVYASSGNVYFNTQNTAHNCGVAGHNCIQQTGTAVGTYAKVNKLCDLPPNACIDLETRAITTKTSGYADTSIVENFDNYTRTSMDCQSAAEELGYDYKGKYRVVTSGAPDLSVSEAECKIFANSIGLTFTAHDDTAITGFTWYENGGCYCGSHYGGVDPGAGAARYTRGWSTANGVASSQACRDICYNLQEAKAARGCVRLPVSTVRSDTSMNDVIVYIRNSYFDPLIQCNANNFAGACIQKLPIDVANGCVLYENNVYWNKGPFSDIVVANSFDECLTLDHCFVGKPEVASDFTPMVEEVQSGAPDLSMTKEDCQTYATTIGRPFGDYSYQNHYANGCTRYLQYNNIYWNENPAASSKVCGDGGHHCIEKKQLSLENCMLNVYKLGKEAGRHSLGAYIDGTGPYTGGTCWYKNSGVLGNSVAAPNCGNRRRLLQLGSGNIVTNPDANDAPYNEDISCTRVENWNDRQVVSFNIQTKANNIGGYVIGATEEAIAITDIDYCRQINHFESIVNDPLQPYGCFVEDGLFYYNTFVKNNEAYKDYEYKSYGGTSSTTVSITNPSLIENAPALVNYGASYEHLPSGQDKLFACEGDCDSDSDCSGNLLCFQRKASQPVPGCSVGGTGDVNAYDYCYDPEALITVTRDAKVGTTWGQVRLPYTATELSSSYVNSLSFEVNRCNNNVDCVGVAVASGYAEAVYRTDTFDACNSDTCSPSIAFFKRKARPLYQAPCTATTPCLKHREKPFNATYALDPVTGTSTCYKGSGGLGMIVDARDHFDLSFGYNAGTATDNGDGTRTMTRGGLSSVYDIINALPTGGWVDGVIYKITIEAKISSGIGTLEWRSGWTTYWTGGLTDEFQTWIFYRVGNWGPNTFKSYISDVTFKQFKIETYNDAISSINASVYAKSRLLANNVQEALPAISGLVRSDDCPAPYIWEFLKLDTSGLPDDSVTKEECEAYSIRTGYDMLIANTLKLPPGCILQKTYRTLEGTAFPTAIRDIDRVTWNEASSFVYETCSEGENVGCVKKINDFNYKTYVLGSVQFDVGADTCDTCFPGHYTSESGVCLPCQAGRYSSKARIVAQGYMPNCASCEPGRFQNEEGQASCKACGRGFYQNERAQLSCKQLDSGNFGVGTGVWTGTSGPDQSNTMTDIATFLEGATDQASDCGEGFFYNCINSDGTKFRPKLDPGETVADVCPNGKFECAQCGKGTYVYNNACVQCPQGQYQDAIPASTTCKVCKTGTYQNLLGQEGCKVTSRGYYQDEEGQSFEEPCLAGSFAAVEKTTLCTLCEAGKFTSQQAATTCDQCSEGDFQNEEGKTSCKRCAAGFYTTNDLIENHGFEECDPCAVGSFRPSQTSGACQLADAGYYVDTEGATFQQQCPAGSKSSGGESNPKCKKCPAGKYQNQRGQGSCKNCDQGYKSVEGYNTKCETCEAGQSTDAEGQSPCEPCALGTYSSVFSNYLCDACARGTYADLRGLSECKKCAIGKRGYGDADFRTEATACENCPHGTYQNEEGQEECKVCSAGFYFDGTGAKNANNEPIGSADSADDCKACPAGRFLADDAYDSQKHNHVDDCKSCVTTGTYSNAGASSCLDCPAGSEAITFKSCIPCGVGKANNVKNSRCKRCNEYSIAVTTGTSECTPCTGCQKANLERTKCEDQEAYLFYEGKGDTGWNGFGTESHWQQEINMCSGDSVPGNDDTKVHGRCDKDECSRLCYGYDYKNGYLGFIHRERDGRCWCEKYGGYAARTRETCVYDYNSDFDMYSWVYCVNGQPAPPFTRQVGSGEQDGVIYYRFRTYYDGEKKYCGADPAKPGNEWMNIPNIRL